MIDISIIAENYSRMSDQELINLANNEGQELTPGALEALKKEFLKRGLDIHIYDSIGEKKQVLLRQNIEQAKGNASTEFTNSLWNYAFDEKKDGKTDKEIITGLMEKGVDEEHSLLIVKSLENKAKELVKAFDNQMLIGGLICGAGIVITVLTISAAQNGGSYVVAWGAIIFGAIRLFKGMSNKDKYKTILENISAEQQTEPIEIKNAW
jgi:hypothetical protein